MIVAGFRFVDRVTATTAVHSSRHRLHSSGTACAASLPPTAFKAHAPRAYLLYSARDVSRALPCGCAGYSCCGACAVVQAVATAVTSATKPEVLKGAWARMAAAARAA